MSLEVLKPAISNTFYSFLNNIFFSLEAPVTLGIFSVMELVHILRIRYIVNLAVGSFYTNSCFVRRVTILEMGRSQIFMALSHSAICCINVAVKNYTLKSSHPSAELIKWSFIFHFFVVHMIEMQLAQSIRLNFIPQQIKFRVLISYN